VAGPRRYGTVDLPLAVGAITLRLSDGHENLLALGRLGHFDGTLLGERLRDERLAFLSDVQVNHLLSLFGGVSQFSSLNSTFG
jgi:hypothetical protein